MNKNRYFLNQCLPIIILILILLFPAVALSICEGDNIRVSVHTDSDSTVNLAEQRLRVTFTPLEDCEYGGSAPSYRNIAIHVHRLDETNWIGATDQLGSVIAEDLQAGRSFTRTFPIPDIESSHRFDRNVEYVVSISQYLRDPVYSGHSSPFRFSFSELPFHFFVPHDGLWVNRNNPQDISWTIPPELNNGSDNIAASFTVELLRSGSVVKQIFHGQVRYDVSSQLCSIPWSIGTDIADADDYKIRVTASPFSAYAEGNYSATMYGTFKIHTALVGSNSGGSTSNGWVTPIEPGQEYVIGQVILVQWINTGTSNSHVQLVDEENTIWQLFRRWESQGRHEWKVGFYELNGDRENLQLLRPVPPPGSYRLKIGSTYSQPFQMEPPRITFWAEDRPNREKVDIFWNPLPPGVKVEIWGTKRFWCGTLYDHGDPWDRTCEGFTYRRSGPWREVRESLPYVIAEEVDGTLGRYTANYSSCEDLCRNRREADSRVERVKVIAESDTMGNLMSLRGWVRVD